MKKALLTAIAVVIAFSLCACGGETAVSGDLVTAGSAAGNRAVDYSFGYPEGWDLYENDGTILIRYDCNKSEVVAEYASVSVMAFGLTDTNMGARDYWNNYREQLEKTLLDMHVINHYEADEENSVPEHDGDETKLGGTVALKVRYTARITEQTYNYDQIICCRNGAVYLVTLTAKNDDYDEVSGVLDIIAGSFVFD